MNFACHCGSVYRAQWLPQGTAYVTYYLESDAWRCINELRVRHFEVGWTNVSDPFNRECQCLSGFRDSLSCQVFLGRLTECFAIAGKDQVVQEQCVWRRSWPRSSLYNLCLNPSAIEAFSQPHWMFGRMTVDGSQKISLINTFSYKICELKLRWGTPSRRTLPM